MNTTFQRLLDQATIDALHATQDAQDYVGNPVARQQRELQLEKFAQLIVRECIDIVKPTQHHEAFAQGYLGDVDGLELLDGKVKQIKQHFGVDSLSIKVGSRIKVISGFNVGAKGTVSYIEPSGKLWVMRDGASSDVFYHPNEIVELNDD